MNVGNSDHAMADMRSVWLTALLLMGFMFPCAAGDVPKELKLKAALVYKLTKFVTWPARALDSDQLTFNLCVLAPDPFGTALAAVEGMKIGGRRVNVSRPRRTEQVKNYCQVLYVPKVHRASLETIFQQLKRQPILTVSDIDHFAEIGGMIEIVRQKRRLGFRINLDAAERTGLKIASPLLDIATVIRQQGVE